MGNKNVENKIILFTGWEGIVKKLYGINAQKENVPMGHKDPCKVPMHRKRGFKIYRYKDIKKS